jgi:hypothetical protein
MEYIICFFCTIGGEKILAHQNCAKKPLDCQYPEKKIDFVRISSKFALPIYFVFDLFFGPLTNFSFIHLKLVEIQKDSESIFYEFDSRLSKKEKTVK